MFLGVARDSYGLPMVSTFEVSNYGGFARTLSPRPTTRGTSVGSTRAMSTTPRPGTGNGGGVGAPVKYLKIA